MQNTNKRNRQNVMRLSHNGQTKSLAEWEKETGISRGTLRERIRRGWDVDTALTAPVLSQGRRGINNEI